MTRTAQCHCGNLSLTAEGEPQHIFMCHCELCQRRTGTSYNLGAWFPASEIVISGESKTYNRKGDIGVEAVFHFCPRCGTNLFWKAAEMVPNMIGVAVGCFADPDFPVPTMSVYGSRRHRWLAVPEGVPAHDGNGLDGGH